MGGFPDLLALLVNLGPAIEALIMVIQGALALIGLWLVTSALFEYWVVSTNSSQRFWNVRDRVSVGSATTTLLIGAFMLALADLKLVGILTRTLTGNYVNSRFMTYTPAGTTAEEYAAAASLTLYGIMQVVGLVAMCKGLLAIHRIGNGQTNVGYGIATTWMLGGLVCWNLKWFADALNNQLGFQVIRLFQF